jgi:hypothetical protein
LKAQIEREKVFSISISEITDYSIWRMLNKNCSKLANSFASEIDLAT